MSDDYKKRVELAMLNFAKRDLKEIDKLQGKRGRPHKKPEKLVEKSCMEWMRAQGWVVSIYESKATYDPRRGLYRNQSMKAGHADCVGLLPGGLSVVVEFKAKGRLSTFSDENNFKQQEFLKERIKMGAFAVVVDSVERLSTLFSTWSDLRMDSDYRAMDYLYQSLPQKKAT